MTLQSGDGITSSSIEDIGPYAVYGGNGIRGFTDHWNRDGTFLLIGRQGALCGNVHLVSGRFWASEHAVVSTSLGYDTSWLKYLLISLSLGQYSVAAAQPGLAVDRIKSINVPVPVPALRSAIAKFLDERTAAIDALIAQKEKLLALLEEKRAALVSHATQTGEDLAVRRIVEHCDYGTSESCEPSGAVPVLRMNNIQDDGLDLSDLKYLNDVDRSLLLRPGDILFNRTNSWALVGKSALVQPHHVEAPTSFASYLVRLRVDERRVRPSYFALVCNSPWFLDQARANAVPSISQANLSASTYLALRLPLPTLSAQDKILRGLEEPLQETQRSRQRTAASIELLREYRQALITAAVTGALDVSSRQAQTLEIPV
jgi:type I restriction enzyme S subunit